MVTVSGQCCSVPYIFLLAPQATVKYTVSGVVQAGDGNIHLATEKKLFL